MAEFDVLDFANKKGIKIVHINARSLFNKKDEIYALYKFCDVIVITETWLNVSIPDSSIMMPDYTLIRQDRYKSDLKKGGGVCIYVKDKYTIDHLAELSEVTSEYEILCIKVKFTNIKPCNIMGVYRPPKGKQMNLIEKLSDILDTLDLIRTELFILGDFNIDYSSRPLLRNLNIRNFETKYNISQIIKTVTRTTELTATILDWIYVSSKYISTSGTLNHNLSDHFPVFIVRKKERNKCIKKEVEGRSYLRYNTERFQALLTEQDWETFDMNNDDPELLWDIFVKNISDVLDQMCPIKKLSVPETKPNWLNNDILLLMRKRDMMYREARKKNDPVLWRKAKFLRNRVESTIKAYKRDKIQAELNRNRNKPKKFWANIREIWPAGSNAAIRTLSDENGVVMSIDHELVNHINDYFANIGNVLATNIKTSQMNGDNILYDMVLNNDTDNITNLLIMQDEFLKVLNEIDINKSSAIENIRAMVIIDAYKGQLPRIIRLYNGSLTRCIFPRKWKKGTVVPLPKVNIPKTASDLRPISLLPLPGKILEHIISNRLKTFLYTNNILTEKQHGFRKNRSTLSAIVEFLHIIYTNLNTGNDSYIIYLDFKKTFDTVCHETLICKLENIGLDLNTIEWFKSYLSNRTQQVKLNGVCSHCLPVEYGVPQGSILGPTLFSLYINDLVNVVNCNIVFYADDTVIVGRDSVSLCENLEMIQQWCNNNYLTINSKKSQWMKTQFLGKNAEAVNLFHINNHSLDRVQEYRYLGLLIDAQLNFQTHRENLVNTVNYKLCLFKKIRKFITIEAASLIYKGTILPIIEYADFVFDYNIKYVNKRLQTLQNQGLYTVFNQHYLSYDLKDSTETLHRSMNLTILEHRRRSHMLSFIFNYRLEPAMLDDREIRTRRHDGILFKEIPKEHYKVQQDPLYRSVKAWNELPVGIRNADTKENLKKMFIATIQNPYAKRVY